MIKHPLFILAAPRSFTSLLCSMIGQHPQAYGVPELNLFLTETLDELQALMVRLKSFQLHGLLRTVAQLYLREQTIPSIEAANRLLANCSNLRTGDFYIRLCEKVAPRQIIDKSPAYAANGLSVFPRIEATFPEAYYLYITRHPRTQGQSMMKVDQGKMAVLSNSIDYSTDPPIIDPQYLWAHIQRMILNFLEQIPARRKMHLRGEDIMGNPELYFEKISQWLGWEWNETAKKAMLRPQDSPYAGFGPYGAPLGNDPNFLRSPIFKNRGQLEEPTLEGPLPWRRDSKGFIPDVLELASQLGYR